VQWGAYARKYGLTIEPDKGGGSSGQVKRWLTILARCHADGRRRRRVASGGCPLVVSCVSILGLGKILVAV